MVYFCCVNGCKKESYHGCGLTFHRIPKDEKMAEKWKEIIPGRVTKTSVVCGLHFEDQDYVNEYGKILKSNVVPSIFPITESTQKTVHILSSRTLESPEEKESESEDSCSSGPPEKNKKIAEDSEESTHTSCSDADTPRKRKLKQEEDSPVSETPNSMRKTIDRLKFVSAQRLKKIRALSQKNRSLEIKNKKLMDDIEDLKNLLKEEE